MNHQPNLRLGRLDVPMEGGRDQLHQQLVAIGNSSLPVTYQPFKFENRRLRIDWRLLHGIEISQVIRDTDLDALERLVSCVTWGDIEAEDTRHLSEANFVKIFRLAQLLLEYLLYVQDNLKYTNSVLEQSRAAALVNVQTINAHCSELQSQLKLCRKELRSTRKTVKSLELLAAAVKAGAMPAAASIPAAAAPNVNVSMQATLQDQQPSSQLQHPQQQQMQNMQQQPQSVGVCSMTAGELLLQTQLTELTDRMAVAGCELERLREEREELQYQVRYLYDMLVARTGGGKSSQRHFSPVRSAMLASRASGSPHSWRRQYGDKYEAAAAAEAEAAAAAAAEEEVARRTAEIKHQLEQQIKRAEIQFQQEFQEQKQQVEQHMQQQKLQLQQQQEELQHKVEQLQHLEMQLGQANLRLEQVQQENQELRSQLCQASAAKTGDADALVASLREQLNDKIRECIHLQGEVTQRESSIATFKQANELLEREIEELQKEKVSPDATTPSFVAKQRKSIALAETKADKLQQQVADLQHQNNQLMQQLAGLKARTAGGSGSTKPSEDPVAAAEQLLGTQGSSPKCTSTAAADKVWQQVAELKQEKLALTQQVDELRAQLAVCDASNPQQQSGEWKLQEINRLQNDNRLMQQKVTSLQQQCNELERLNAQLERQIAKGQTPGPVTSQEPTATDPSDSVLAAAIAASGGGHGGGWARASVASAASAASSGPKQELTAADLATEGMSVGPEHDLQVSDAAGHAAREGSGGPQDHDNQGQAPGVVRSVVVRPAAQQQKQAGAAAVKESTAAVKVDASWIKKTQLAQQAAADDGGGSEGDSKIPAYRPSAEQQQAQQQVPAPAEPVAEVAVALAANASTTSGISSTSSAAAAGQISKEAAVQMKELMAQLALMPQDKQAAEYKEFCEDWDTPFDLSAEEKDWFVRLLQYEVPGKMGLLTATPHSADEYAAHHGRLLVQVNKQLDAQLASYGIHPGRTGLNNMEFLAAMGMLNERRQAWEAQLSPDLKQQVEAARCGILLHPYNITQQLLQQQLDGPDGKKHLPRVTQQSLTSAVRPPTSMLPAGPAAIRVSSALSTQARAASQSATGALAVSPGASSRYQNAAAFESNNESQSPQHHPLETNRSTSVISSGPLGAAMSPVKASAAAAALQVASRAASYSTVTYHAESASGRSSPDVSEQWSQATAPGVAYSPMSAALQKKASPRGPTPSHVARTSAASAAVSAAASAAVTAVGVVSGLHNGTASKAESTMQSVQQQGGFVPSVGPSRVVGSGSSSNTSPGHTQPTSKAASPGMAAAFKQYMGTSFDESGEL